MGPDKDGLQTFHFPETPALQVPRPLTELLPGKYVLTVVATVGGGGDTIARGSLDLWPTDTAQILVKRSLAEFPAVGATDVDFASLGQVSLAYSPASRDPAKPGVQAFYDTFGRTLSFIAGNAATRQGSYTNHGVIFYVFQFYRSGFAGRWADGGFESPLPEGYFCAVRLPDDERS